MAGHSHAKNVMHRKEAQNKKRSKILSKIAHAIAVAVKLGGTADSNSNAKLRLALKQAQAASMPKEIINRAIENAQKKGCDDNLEEIIYEAYFSPIAIMIETLTSNRNKTGPEIKAILNKYGASIEQPNSLNFLFDKFAAIDCIIEKNQVDEFSFYAIDCSAVDILLEETSDEKILITPLFEAEKLHIAQEQLEKWNITQAQMRYIPKTFKTLCDEKKEKFFKMLEALEENENTQTCWHNYKESD